jgi:hypothetical protein
MTKELTKSAASERSAIAKTLMPTLTKRPAFQKIARFRGIVRKNPDKNGFSLDSIVYVNWRLS